MSLKYGKKEIDQMVEALVAEHDSAEDAAMVALAVAEEIFERRSQFVVVGQLISTPSRPAIAPEEPEAIKLSLGWYSTRGDADKAAESLYKGTASGDRFRVWVLPVFHESPTELHAKRKAAYVADEAKAQEKASQAMKKSIEKHREAMELRAAGGKGSCSTCGHHPFDHVTAGTSRGKCAIADCACAAWIEKTKA